jgi:hypothetical protein
MGVFSPSDVAIGFGAVLQLMFDTGSIWILLLTVVGTIAVDDLAPRRSRPPRKKPKT